MKHVSFLQDLQFTGALFSQPSKRESSVKDKTDPVHSMQCDGREGHSDLRVKVSVICSHPSWL